MKNYAVTTLSLALVLTLSSTTYAAAQSVYGDVEGSADTSIGVSGVVNSNFGTGVKGVVHALVGAQATTSGSSGSSGSTSGSASVGTTGALGTIVITRADVDTGTAAAVNVSPTSVSSDADLSGFVAAEIAADENVSEIEASAHNVSVTYKQKARLFGFIPVMVNATATVRADGSVDVRYPWYAFLMVTNENDLEAAIQDRVGVSVSPGTGTEVNASGTFSSSVQASLISEVRTVMAEQLAADSAGSARAAVDAEGAVHVQ